MKVLVIDDEEVSRSMIGHFLSQIGCEYDLAASGLEGVRLFAKALRGKVPYNLVFCDIMMPEMDGHHAAIILRELELVAGLPPRLETHIVMTTMLDDAKNVFKAFSEGGAYTYLVKPCKQEDVLNEIKKVQQKQFKEPPLRK